MHVILYGAGNLIDETDDLKPTMIIATTMIITKMASYFRRQTMNEYKFNVRKMKIDKWQGQMTN